MKSKVNKQYYNYLISPEWKEFRRKALAHYGNKCSKCARTKSLQVHHLHYNNIFHEQLEDVVILCKLHHEEAHNKKKKPIFQKPKKKKLTIKGQVIKWRRYEKRREKKRLKNKPIKY